MRCIRQLCLWCGAVLFVAAVFLGADAPRRGTAKPILIGAVVPKTGEAATFGISTENGIRMALDEVNAAGGLLGGRKLTLICEDDKGDAIEGRNAFSKLVNRDRVCAIIGTVMSKVSIAGAPICEQAKIPMISPTSTNPLVTAGKRYVFRACFIDPFQGKVMASFARNNLKAQTAAVLYDAANDYTKGLAEEFQKSFESLGGKVLAMESYAKGSTDFRPQLTKIHHQNPDVLFLSNYYNDVGLQAKQAREMGIKARLLGGDGWDSPELFKVAGDAVEGGYFSNHFTHESTNPKAQAFVKAYRERYKTDPDALAALGYEAAIILTEAIRSAKSDNPEQIRAALEQTDIETITGRIRFDSNHNPVKAAVILKIQGGRHVFETLVSPEGK